MEEILFLGFGGHAESIADSIINGDKYNIVGYTDLLKSHSRYPYLGTDDDLDSLYKKGIHKAVIGVGYLGDSGLRDTLVRRAKDIGFEFPTIVDRTAILADDVELGEGTFVGKRVIINSASIIGSFCIINTGSIIEHDNRVGNFSHVAVGAVLCGEVIVGHHSLIGAGTTVIQRKKIGDRCIVGANSTVLSDVENGKKVYGVVK